MANHALAGRLTQAAFKDKFEALDTRELDEALQCLQFLRDVVKGELAKRKLDWYAYPDMSAAADGVSADGPAEATYNGDPVVGSDVLTRPEVRLSGFALNGNDPTGQEFLNNLRASFPATPIAEVDTQPEAEAVDAIEVEVEVEVDPADSTVPSVPKADGSSTIAKTDKKHEPSSELDPEAPLTPWKRKVNHVFEFLQANPGELFSVTELLDQIGEWHATRSRRQFMVNELREMGISDNGGKTVSFRLFYQPDVFATADEATVEPIAAEFIETIDDSHESTPLADESTNGDKLASDIIEEEAPMVDVAADSLEAVPADAALTAKPAPAKSASKTKGKRPSTPKAAAKKSSSKGKARIDNKSDTVGNGYDQKAATDQKAAAQIEELYLRMVELAATATDKDSAYKRINDALPGYKDLPYMTQQLMLRKIALDNRFRILAVTTGSPMVRLITPKEQRDGGLNAGEPIGAKPEVLVSVDQNEHSHQLPEKIEDNEVGFTDWGLTFYRDEAAGLVARLNGEAIQWPQNCDPTECAYRLLAVMLSNRKEPLAQVISRLVYLYPEMATESFADQENFKQALHIFSNLVRATNPDLATKLKVSDDGLVMFEGRSGTNDQVLMAQRLRMLGAAVYVGDIRQVH